VGNLLLGDEGVGVHLLRKLEEEPLPPSVERIDGGTRGLALFPYLEHTTHLLILDAVRVDAPPGTVVVLGEKDLLRGPAIKFSAHDVALPDLLAWLRVLRDGTLEDIRLVGVVTAPFQPGVGLSKEVERALPEAVHAVWKVIRLWMQGITERLPLKADG
jgi:hydrogenase maturation protease